MGTAPMSLSFYHRLIRYLRVMKRSPIGQAEYISSSVIAEKLGMNDVQVRNDLAIASHKGRPKIGFVTKELIADLEHFLGCDNYSSAALVGVGNLGKALLTYESFEKFGLNITCGFDSSPALIGSSIGGKEIVDVAKLKDLCLRLSVHIGIITVPSGAAQEVCDCLIEGGIRAIWNFAPVDLSVPSGIILRSEDMASSLAMLQRQLLEQNFDHEKPESK
jgi:redox-sensing transcriptional repressor